MKPIATINGVKVFSDKRVNSINNTRVVFSDGSWCDVKSNEIVNKGKGTISIGAASSGTSTHKTIGPKYFDSDIVNVSDVEADVSVVVGKKLSVVIAGPEDDINKIVLCATKDQLFVQGQAKVKNNSTVLFSGINIVGSINASDTSIDNPVQITITVPSKTALNMSGIIGNTTIGDTDGTVIFCLQGDHDVDIGRIGNASLVLQGSGDIMVGEANGDVMASLNGSGDITVGHGSIGKLWVNLIGSGDVQIGGKSRDAILAVVGSGDIDVAYVETTPQISKSGSGDIAVGNW